MNSAQKVIELCWPGSKSKPGDTDSLALRETKDGTGNWMLFSMDDRIDLLHAVSAFIAQPPGNHYGESTATEYGNSLLPAVGLGSIMVLADGKYITQIAEAPPHARARALLKIYERRQEALVTWAR